MTAGDRGHIVRPFVVRCAGVGDEDVVFVDGGPERAVRPDHELGVPPRELASSRPWTSATTAAQASASRSRFGAENELTADSTDCRIAKRRDEPAKGLVGKGLPCVGEDKNVARRASDPGVQRDHPRLMMRAQRLARGWIDYDLSWFRRGA